MEKLARQITDDKIQELNERIESVDGQVFRYLIAGDNASYFLSNSVSDIIGFDEVELNRHYMLIFKGLKDDYNNIVEVINSLKDDMLDYSVKELSHELQSIDDDINYLVERLNDIINSMLKKEYLRI